MDKLYDIREIVFFGDTMRIKIDGLEYEFLLKDISGKLLNASQLARETYDISPSGYGIHWPVIDEDLSVNGLLKAESRLPLQKKGA